MPRLYHRGHATLIRIGNYSQLQSQIRALQERLSPARVSEAIREARTQMAQAGLEWIRVYPPTTIANSPSNPSGRWYERGFGPRWRTRGGSGGRQTSEHLGEKWSIVDQGAVGAAIRNVASYASFVQAAESQASFHAARGWKTDRGLIEWLRESGTALRIMQEAIRKALRLSA